MSQSHFWNRCGFFPHLFTVVFLNVFLFALILRCLLMPSIHAFIFLCFILVRVKGQAAVNPSSPWAQAGSIHACIHTILEWTTKSWRKQTPFRDRNVLLQGKTTNIPPTGWRQCNFIIHYIVFLPIKGQYNWFFCFFCLSESLFLQVYLNSYCFYFEFELMFSVIVKLA